MALLGAPQTRKKTSSALWRGAQAGVAPTTLPLRMMDSFLISFRVLDTVAIVDRATGEFTWKWGRGQISHQHHPTRLPNGHVLLLDNGAHRRGLSFFARCRGRSRHQRDRLGIPRRATDVPFYSLHGRRGAGCPTGILSSRKDRQVASSR